MIKIEAFSVSGTILIGGGGGKHCKNYSDVRGKWGV